ncbi:unnamed protein product [Cunninghamella blakesleeana]
MHPGTIVLIVIGSVGVIWGGYEIGSRFLDWVSYRREQKKYEEYLRQYYEKHQSQTNDNIISSPQPNHFDEKKDSESNDDDDDDDDVPLAYHPSLRRRKIFNKESEDSIIKENEKEMENHFLQQRGNSIMGIFNDNDEMNDFDDQSMYLLKKPTAENPPTYQEVDSPSSITIADESMEKKGELSSSPVLIDSDSNNNSYDENDETVLVTNEDINSNNSNNNNNDNDNNNGDENTAEQQQNSGMVINAPISPTVYLNPQPESESGNSSNSFSQDSWASLVPPSSSSDSLSPPNHQQNNNNINNNSSNSLLVNNDDMTSSFSSTSSFSVISISDDDLQR